MILRLIFFFALFSYSVLAEDGRILGIYFTPGFDCETQIIKHISTAQKIEIAVYSINNDNIVAAMFEAHKRGAHIRIVTDRVQAAGKWSKVSYIKGVGIPLRINRRHKIEHNKFAVFDGHTVVNGSYNWTNPATAKNSENCVFFADSKGSFQNRFEYLWEYYE